MYPDATSGSKYKVRLHTEPEYALIIDDLFHDGMTTLPRLARHLLQRLWWLCILLQEVCCKPIALCLLSHAHQCKALEVPAQSAARSTTRPHTKAAVRAASNPEHAPTDTAEASSPSVP